MIAKFEIEKGGRRSTRIVRKRHEEQDAVSVLKRAASVCHPTHVLLLLLYLEFLITDDMVLSNLFK